MNSNVNTGKVAQHRKLRFNTIDEAQQELNRIVAADQAGTLRAWGNWTPGQNLGHVASWINYSFDSPAFGPMSAVDRIQLNLRHAELHFGFLEYS